MDSDEEFEEEVAIQKAPKKKKDKKGKKSIEEADPMFCSLYKEAESDDEFAKEFLMFPNGNPDNDDEDRKGKRAKRKAFKKKKNNVTINASTDENTPSSINECNDDPLDGNLNLVAAEDSGDEQNEDDENQSDDDDDEKIDYRIQYILDCRSLSAMEWKDILIKMDTREVTRGSVLQQPDEEFYDPSPELVEKFLIKWQHASFLHLSWETEKDLLDICGKTVSNSIKKFRYRILTKTDLFEDLRMGESFPPQYLHVDRILDIEDDTVNIQTMDWAKARLPSYGGEVESASTNAIVDEVAEEKEDEEVVDTEATDTATDDTVDMMSDENDLKDSPIKSTSENEPKRSKRKVVTGSDKAETKKKSRKPKIVDLHGANCWVVVKWEGLAYSEFTLESAYDLSKAGVEYEFALREFFRREQQAPRVGVRGKVVRSLFNMATVLESPEPPIFPVGQLRDYQWEGVRWLLFNWSQKRNSILADEMGLGKTIQTAAYMQMLKRFQGLKGPFLIVAPLSTVVNWQREIAAWTDMDAIIYHGSQDDRELIRKYELEYVSGNHKKTDGVKIEVVIASPETCMTSDSRSGSHVRKELSKIHWELIVVDEAHKIKNYDSKLSTTLREEYSYRNTLLLTGTPLQNNIDELWTLLNFIDRDTFADRDEFVTQFGNLKSSAQLEALHAKLKPYLLRREKDHVEKTVPPKEELIIEVELTVPQKQYYRAIYEQNTRFLFRGEAKDGPRLCNLAMELRKCCNHPFLIKGAEKVLAEHFVGDSPLDIMIKASGKMSFLDKLLPKLQADGHRVLIFSQFRIMLDIIEDYMSLRGFSYERVDGAVTGKKRQAAIDRYSNTTSADPNSIFAMLLSTRAGGVGINLTAADTVIIFDSDWNPQNDLQAQARAHRIGQTKTVKVYRLMMRKSYEMVMFKAASLKLGLDYAVMHNMNAGSSAQEQLQQLKQDIADAGGNEDDGTTSNAVTGSATKPRTGKGTGRRGGKGKKEIEGISLERTENYSSLSKRELENLLKHGAYDIFREEKDGTTNEESAKFHEADIDQILQRSAVVLHDEKGNSAIAKTSGIASFAKASFVSSLSANGASDNLALDDPDFWTKVVGLASKEEEYSDGNRKRKCAREVSYKEPGMSAFRAVHDSDSDDEEGGRRKKKGVRDPEEPEPVVLNDENLQRITTSLVARGYGNWNTLRSDTKLFWTASDMSRGSRLVILQLLKWAAMSLKSFTGSEEGTDEKEATKSTVGSVTQQVTEFDLKYLESFLRRSRACRLAIAAFERDPFHGDALTHTPATAPESTEIAVDQAVAVTIAEDVLTRQVLELAVGSSSYVDAPAVGSMTVDGISADNGEIESAVTHDALAQVYQAFDNIYPLKVTQASQPASEQGAEAAEDTIKSETAETSESIQSESEQKNPMDKVVELLLSLHLPAEFTEFETERAGKVRFAARSKLSQIEDMFELRLACDLLDQYSVKSSHLDDAIVEETVPLVVQSPIETFLATSSLKAWGVEEDIKLIRAVDKIGWPEGKRRVSNIVEVFIPPIDSEQSNGEVSAELTTDEQNFLVEEEIKSNSITDIAQTVADEQVDIEAEASELAEATTDQVMSENSTEVTLKTYLDDSKFLAKRVKLLAQTLRDFTRPKVEESNRAAERAEAAAERERLAAERIAERERKAAEKAAEKALVQASKDAELKQRRFAQAILRTIARVGRPRSMYAPLREEVHKKLQETIASGGEHYDATTVLITWEQFTADVGLDPTVEENVERVQTAVTTLLQIGEDIISAAPTASTTTPTATSTEPTASTNNADESPKKDDIKDDEKENNDAEGKPIVKDTKMVTTGLFAKVTHRMIESCLDKAHLLHQIRVAVVQHGIDNFFQLRSTVRRSLKGAGPNTQKQKRDTTLPAWWTPYHDTALLQAVLELATPQVNIESIAAEDEESQEVPPEMEMTTSAAKREKEREKEKEKEPTGINWKDIASLPSISKPLPNFSLGFSNPADWVMSISPKVAEKRFQTLIQAPGVLSVSELVPPGSPDVTRKRNTSVQKVVKKPGLLPSAFGARPAWVSSFPSTNKPAATTTASTVTAPTATVSSTSSEPMVVDLQDDDEDVLEVVNICTVPTPASVLAPISTTAIIELIVAVPAEQVQVENKSVSPTELHPQQTNEVVTIDITVDAHPPTVSKDDSIQKEMKLLGDKENLRNASTVSPTTVLDFDPTPQKAPITQVEPVNSSAAPVSVKKASKEKQAPMKAGAILGFFKKAV